MGPDAPKTLAEMGAVFDGSGWPHGDQVIRAMLERCHQSEALRVIHELIAFVESMGIAERFRTDRYAYQSEDASSDQLDRLDRIFGRGDKLSEAGHKRATLLIALQAVRQKLVLAFGDLASVRLDIEATHLNDDGTPAPELSPEETIARDRFDPSAGR